MNDMNEWPEASAWKDLHTERSWLLRVLRKLLTEIASVSEVVELREDTVREAWSLVTRLEEPRRLEESPDATDHMPRILAKRPGMTHSEALYDTVQQALEGGGDGTLECLQDADEIVARAFARLLERLLNRGLLDGRDVANILCAPGIRLSREKA